MSVPLARCYEREFEDRLIALQNDGRACAVFLYTDLAVHHLASSDAEISRLLTVQSPLWRAALGAMQSATFVALGRLYDDDPGAHSAAAVLDYASRYLGLFSRSSLTVRKIRVRSCRFDWCCIANRLDAGHQTQRGPSVLP